MGKMEGNRPEGREPFEAELWRDGELWSLLGVVVTPDDDPSYLYIHSIKQP